MYYHIGLVHRQRAKVLQLSIKHPRHLPTLTFELSEVYLCNSGEEDEDMKASTWL